MVYCRRPELAQRPPLPLRPQVLIFGPFVFSAFLRRTPRLRGKQKAADLGSWFEGEYRASGLVHCFFFTPGQGRA
jgi:hypothetical protein